MTTITHHNIVFSIDTMDWSDQESREIAEAALIDGIRQLSNVEVQRIEAAWTDFDAECESRNANDDVAKIVESIENEAFSAAIAGWVSTPDTGHNCLISICANGHCPN